MDTSYSAPFTGLLVICLAEITLSKVPSATVIPLVSKSATMATAASSSPRSRHKVMTSSYRGLQAQQYNSEIGLKFHIKHIRNWLKRTRFPIMNLKTIMKKRT